ATPEPPCQLPTPEWNGRPRCIGITTQPAHDNGGGYEELARTRSCRRGSARRRPASVRALSRVGESGRGGLESEVRRTISFFSRRPRNQRASEGNGVTERSAGNAADRQ